MPLRSCGKVLEEKVSCSKVEMVESWEAEQGHKLNMVLLYLYVILNVINVRMMEFGEMLC
jgi:hypothetical protein